MEYSFLMREGHPRLLLLFSGWGGEPSLFSHYHPKNADFLLCYDYRSLDFDSRLLEDYREIRLAAWSMGVWAAGMVLQGCNLPFSAKIAVNGTPWPIDDSYGIPKALFQGTLERFDAVGLSKFRRRMCGDADNVKRFLSCCPSRHLDDLKAELSALFHEVGKHSAPSFSWSRALIGGKDKIFPSVNQQAAWERASTPHYVFDEEHYSELLFSMALECSPEGML